MIDYLAINDDWYDSEGRIYKDKLIDVFNAIEDKCNEITSITPSEIVEPDYDNTIYPDVTLETEDKTSIVNLKSFVDILNLKYTPLELQQANGVILKLTYYDNDYTLKEITYHTLTTTENCWIGIDKATDTVIEMTSLNSVEDVVYIGFYNKSLETIYTWLDSPVATLHAEDACNKLHMNTSSTLSTGLNNVYGDYTAGGRAIMNIFRSVASSYTTIAQHSYYVNEGYL